ncbi:MAG: glycosyltransferase, partial [Flavobacteriales bacterium]|nr:glycosyltransferase [Flavobacteriales bacterium]
METQKIKTALVILNWNGKNWLEKFLPNILNLSKDVNVFLVDNASTDDSVSFVEEYYNTVTIISNRINGGFAKGYNDSLRHINAEYYILLNS